MHKGFAIVLLPFLASGCSRLALNNHSLDYQKAASLPPLVVPTGVSMRRQVPLYPVPEVQASTTASPALRNDRGNRYVLPQPQPLDAAQLAVRAQADVGIPAAPVLVTDGNGYPLLRVEGSAPRIWALVTQALQAAGVASSAQNESLGQINLTHQQKPVLLRLDRSGTSTLITVQSGQNTLAEPALANDLLAQIAGHWPR